MNQSIKTTNQSPATSNQNCKFLYIFLQNLSLRNCAFVLYFILINSLFLGNFLTPLRKPLKTHVDTPFVIPPSPQLENLGYGTGMTTYSLLLCIIKIQVMTGG